MAATTAPDLTTTAGLYVARRGIEAYRREYEAGWRTSRRTGNLDAADASGRSGDDAWLDGYLDFAAGREKWHLLTCPDHEACA